MKTLQKLLILVGALAMPFCAYAMPANPEPELYTQPDGSIIEVYTYGDEYYNFIGDKDGYMLEKNADGTYEYIVADVPMLMSLDGEADGAKPLGAVNGFDFRNSSENQLNKANTVYPTAARPQISAFSLDNTEPTMEKRKLMVVAVEFADIKFTDKLTPDEISKRFFSYDDGVLSVNNYYKEVSGSAFGFEPAFEADANATQTGKVADGVYKVVLDTNHPNPQKAATPEDKDARVAELVTSAIQAVDEGFDFTAFNTNPEVIINSENGVTFQPVTNKDGKEFLWDEELIIYFVVAGYEASAKNGDNSVWAHRYIVPDGGVVVDNLVVFDDNPVTIDDKTYYFTSSYAMAGAMHDDDNPMGIGVYCHELGHVLGLVDLYNTDNQSNDYAHVGDLSLMATGSWGKASADAIASSMPTHLDPWSKMRLGWYDVAAIGAGYTDQYDVFDVVPYNTTADAANKKYHIYIVATDENLNEYFIIENRSFSGYDAALGYRGMVLPGIAIWHIDENVIFDKDANGLSNFNKNSVNNTNKPGVALERSAFGLSDFYDGAAPLWSAGVNRLSYFGSASVPSSVLNTYEGGLSASGAEMDVLSAPGDVMRVRIGAKNVRKAFYSKDGNVSMYIFNPTASQVTATPTIAEYEENEFKRAIKLGDLTIPAGGYTATVKKDYAMTSGNGYRVFSFDYNNMKPITSPVGFTYK